MFGLAAEGVFLPERVCDDTMLPLLENAKNQNRYFFLTIRPEGGGLPPSSHCGVGLTATTSRIPQRDLQPGEQYRFHFDMTKCIGCKCCVVACNEQNGNPAEINWRRVGEIEGGWYPNTQRFHLSMGCNHCIDPTCLAGCPVDAYSKDPLTGVVLHNPEVCIGCQYCTWNCSYGVPQYNPERGVVGKCDMCHTRLAQSREPACVSACPEGAIEIEIANIADWMKNYSASANAPGLPSADDSVSSTRITLPPTLPPNMQKANMNRVRPEAPHLPLVAMTVLTQLSVGTFCTIWLLDLLGQGSRLGVAAILSLLVAAVALAASTMHLGRPAYAYRALKMWRRSWLSREVLLFSTFSVVAAVYAFLLWFRLPGSIVPGILTALIGLAAVTASARIYIVRARPAWNSKHTIAEFHLTGPLLGSLLVAGLGIGDRRWLTVAAMAIAGASLLNQVIRFFWMTRSDSAELQASAKLLSTALASAVLVRGGLLVVGGVVLPLLWLTAMGTYTSFAVTLTSETLGRYLFFVSVVPKNMAASYLSARTAA